MPATRENIIVHLERSRTARAFDRKGRESLWGCELNKIYRILARHVETLSGKENGNEAAKDSWKEDKRPLLSIAVFGTHGSGKSSLLKTLVEEVNGKRFTTDREEEKSTLSTLKDKLYSLPVIEPNRTEDEHFLYTFLATALEEDLRKNERERTPLASRTLTQVQHAFQEVSEYLQVIDKVERQNEHDPLGFSLERLERHTSGLLLRRKLNTFHDKLAESLAGTDSASLVLLPVDDPDMSLDSLVATLETYRRYLQHPRLVPVFTFTGRLAEELLRVHFARNLLLEESRNLFLDKTHADPSSPLDMSEHLAVQYLVKLFPIRNRIRLGPAPARVQGADYEIGWEEGRLRSDTRGTEGKSRQNGQQVVWNLLEGASNLLFGYPEWPIAPRIRLALRPATLRRQLQVLDAMHDSWITEVLYFQNPPDGDEPRRQDLKEHRWVQIFDRAAWSLVNVHRDVVREFRMQVEELHSLTPRNLSRDILNAILSLDLEPRRELLQRWRLQVEDRRSQILSLLALNAFRPHMEKEELTGDDPDAVRIKREDPGTGGNQEKNNSFSSQKGTLWFLDLWLGFYLPQILARDRPNDIAERNYELRSVRGVGWSLRSGPRHAISEVLVNGHISATGMMLLDPTGFSTALGKQEGNKIEPAALAIHLWCFYGYRRGKPWAAVSFWRGLGLLGQILEDYQRDGTQNIDLADREKRIRVILAKHCETAKEPGSFQVGKKGHSFSRWDFDNLLLDRPSGREDAADKLVADLCDWLIRHGRHRITPLEVLPKERKDEATWWKEAYSKSFTRRLHGEYLLGELWPALGGAYLEGRENKENEEPWNAYEVLRKWSDVLFEYFKDVSLYRSDGEPESKTLKEMLEKCPLLSPFTGSDDPVWRGIENELKQTDWEHSPFSEPKS